MKPRQNGHALEAVFIMEQHIGHRSYYLNLRRHIDLQSKVQARWVEVTYEQNGVFGTALKLLPKRLGGPLAGSSQEIQGLRRPYDIAVFNTQVPAALSLGRANRKPAVLCLDITPLQYDQMAALYHHPTDPSKLVRRIKHNANCRLLGNAARLLPWSSWVRDSLVADYQVDPAKIEILPPGVDLDFWKPDGNRRGSLPRILFVGGDFHRKGGALLLEAFQALAPGTAELVLVTRSELPARPGVRVYNHMQPNSPELIQLYQSCDIFVLPTQAEAFGIAAVEACAAGLPVIATRVGGLRDIVLDAENGYLVPGQDPGALTRRLKTLIADPDLRRSLGQKSRQHANLHFDARKNTARMLEILMEIVCHE
jgi:glycosyltransferase involved in cell wall biosynthesis